MSLESVIASNHLILCRPLSSCLQSFPAPGSFPRSQFFAIGWPKYWSFSFNISSSNEYSGLISFQVYGFDLPAVRGTFKSLLQHHNWKASILWHSAFFMIQYSYPYMTIGKPITLIRQTFVGKVMSLPFNMLSRFVIASTLWLLIQNIEVRCSLEKCFQLYHKVSFYPEELPGIFQFLILPGVK